MKIKYNRFYYNPLPDEVCIKESPVHGHGIFASQDIKRNTDLGATHIKVPMILTYIRTPLGGFINHSEKPNCEAVYDGDFIKIITLSNINSGDEITVDYTKHDWIKKNQ